jgi:DNA-binding transcriptional ArsR family regulator
MASATLSRKIDRVAYALSDETRRSLLTLVRDDERSAGDLALRFPHMSRPAVSQHLRVLRDADLVTTRVDGNRRLYRAELDGLEEMRRFLDDMWSDRLTRLKRAAERSNRDRNHR